MKSYLTALAMLWALTTSAVAHELRDNRATLVLRDRQHLSITFFVDYPSVLHQVLAPQRSAQEFVMTYSAMKPQEFQAQLQEAQRKLTNSTVLMLASGKAAVITQWVWPTATAVQNLLQQRAMQAVVAPDDHAHTVQMEIRAEVISAKVTDFSSVTLQLPPAFQHVLVVSYQPKQVWLKPNTPSRAISF
jgi:ABC-type molybdate transport system ATPase subunit